jgi:hypothetical protein
MWLPSPIISLEKLGVQNEARLRRQEYCSTACSQQRRDKKKREKEQAISEIGCDIDNKK